MSTVIGILSYNEGPRLERICDEIGDQVRGIDCSVLVVDESDDFESSRIARGTSCREGFELIPGSSHRMGKVHGLNQLAERALTTGAQSLLHFDADITLGSGCIKSLLKTIESGFDLVAPASLARSGRNLFERTLRVMSRPGESRMLSGSSSIPLPGHAGGYSRAGLKAVFPIPEDGTNEEIWALLKCMNLGLRTSVVSAAVVYHRLQTNISDYVDARRRIYNHPLSPMLRTIGSPIMFGFGSPLSAVRDLTRAVRTDLLASGFLPYALVLRLAAHLSATPSGRRTWKPVTSAK